VGLPSYSLPPPTLLSLRVATSGTCSSRRTNTMVELNAFWLIQAFRVRNGCRWPRWRAPLVGASKPWCPTSSGVNVGEDYSVHCCAFMIIVVIKVLPLTIPLTYFLLLPRPSSISIRGEEGDTTECLVVPSAEYAPLPTDEDEDAANERRHPRAVALSASDKWRLVKPMIPRYMIPLCECLFIQLQTDFLTLASRQVCVYLVSRYLGKVSSTCSSILR